MSRVVLLIETGSEGDHPTRKDEEMNNCNLVGHEEAFGVQVVEDGALIRAFGVHHNRTDGPRAVDGGEERFGERLWPIERFQPIGLEVNGIG